MDIGYKTLAAVTVAIIFCSSCVLAGDISYLEEYPPATVSNASKPSQQTRQEVSCELRVKEKYEYYDIDGADVSELRKKMNKAGTKWNDGKTYAAVTSWDIRYDYEVFHQDGRCSIKSVKTKVDIVYNLPRWITSAAGPELTVLWDNYMTRLKEHEFGHKNLAVKTAAEINEVLASLSNFSTRAELDQEITRRTEEKFQRLKEEQVHYDDETRHGETQGAVLTAHSPSLALNN